MSQQLSLSLNLKLGTYLTPQLQAAIKLLQLSRLELQERVQQELQENPFLEESGGEDILQEREEDREGYEDAVYDKDLAKEADWEDYLGEFSSTPKRLQREFESLDEISPMEARFAAKPTLEGHLLWQLYLSSMTKRQQAIGEVIIGNIEPTGYLTASVEEVADMAKATPEEVQTVLDRIHFFDPVGVGARDAKECLLIQLRNLNYDRDPILVDIVTSHLEDLEAKHYKPILRKFKLEMEDMGEYLDILQSLEPMPGASFGGSEPSYVTPDVYVYEVDGKFEILLNDDGLPQLRLSSLSQMDMRKASEEAKKFYDDKKRSAEWLIRSLQQRQRTLYKVVESIVRFQEAFFRGGVTKLAPLILKDIADDIEMHESTVSRITTNKYVSTPHGIYELKFFFNSGLGLDDGSQVGSESVKALIRKFVSEEDASHPLSDEKLVSMLKDSLNVTVARRTVAKYRTALNIPPSSQRKEFFPKAAGPQTSPEPEEKDGDGGAPEKAGDSE
jgi:RNA polymerase sigma-54 factor